MRKMSDIKLIVLDVDGVLTDGKLLIGSDGTEYKSFHVKDGLGINLAQFFGLKVAIITGRKSKAVHIRAKELNIDYLYEGITNKVEVLQEIISLLDLKLSDVFYMGDDLNDLSIIELVGCSAAPKDAIKMIRESVDFVSSFTGGNGAVREAIEYILSQQTNDHDLMRNYLVKQASITQ